MSDATQQHEEPFKVVYPSDGSVQEIYVYPNRRIKRIADFYFGEKEPYNDRHFHPNGVRKMVKIRDADGKVHTSHFDEEGNPLGKPKE